MHHRARRRPKSHPLREIVDALRHVRFEGCRWRALPAGVTPYQTVHGFFRRWTRGGIWKHIRDRLRRAVRCQMGTSPHAVATVLDTHEVEAAGRPFRYRGSWGV
ncbi:hypothetical protein GCM10018785_10180 [Streptomyces longispororuber]|uniref:Insertion element IS402-like domain-containing protein n=1 Tax=Streptomyces longispororuber TaxID=68230 RepID=A0A918Z9V9_9ACTN|nr:hypothetical protein GCM10018785_10180 [Streptomyces longispororuber]